MFQNIPPIIGLTPNYFSFGQAPSDHAPQRLMKEESIASIPVSVRLFGEYDLKVGDTMIDLPRQAKSILAYLLVHRGQPVSKETLMEIFWPETFAFSRECARRSLNVEITRLRRALELAASSGKNEVIRHQIFGYSLDPAMNWVCDWDDFCALKRQIQEMRQGAAYPVLEMLDQLRQFLVGFLTYFPAKGGQDWLADMRRTTEKDLEYMTERLLANLLDGPDCTALESVATSFLERYPHWHGARLLLAEYLLQNDDKVGAGFHLRAVQAGLKDCPDAVPAARLNHLIASI